MFSIRRSALAAALAVAFASDAMAAPVIGYREDFPASGGISTFVGGANLDNPGTGGAGGDGDGYLNVETLIASNLGTVSFGPEYANELPFSSCVAKHCQTRHHIVELSPAVVLRHLDESIAFLSDPVGDPLTVPNALLFREAAHEVGVVLNGEGGDPCFGGPKNIPMLLAELFGDGAEGADAGDACCRERSYLRAHQKCYDDLPSMLTPNVRAAIADNALELQLAPCFADPRWTSFIAKLMALNITFKAPFHILHKVDSVSAPFGAVARSPLFDRAIVAMAMSIPPQLKLRGSSEKYLLKQAVRDLLPPAIIDRPKSGMLVPVESWFRGPLLGVARERLLDGLTGFGLFEHKYLERLLDGRMGPLRPRSGVKIWLLLTLFSPPVM